MHLRGWQLKKLSMMGVEFERRSRPGSLQVMVKCDVI